MWLLRQPAAAASVLLLARWVAAVRLRHSDAAADFDECPPGSACPEMHSSAFSGRVVKLAAVREPIDLIDPANVSLPEVRSPDMFVAIFTALDYPARRHAARWAWHGAEGVTAKFMACRSPQSLAALDEYRMYKDMAFLDCAEGYRDGLLTKKLVAALRHYRKAYAQVPLFFKTDDDTFVRSGAVLATLKDARAQSAHVFGGLWYPQQGVVRTPDSQFYQPLETFPDDCYPPSCAGGPGYGISSALVDEILGSAWPEKYPLTCEDRAISVWVSKADEQSGLHVRKVSMAGTDGYGLNKCETFRGSTWSQYDLVLLHKLSPKALLCMGRAWRPSDRLDQCFCA